MSNSFKPENPNKKPHNSGKTEKSRKTTEYPENRENSRENPKTSLFNWRQSFNYKILSLILATSALIITANRTQAQTDLKNPLQTIQVPLDYPSIQDAINAAVNGNSILVEPGTYPENLDFSDKSLSVQSETGPDETAINGGGENSVVTMWSNSTDTEQTLDGFTLFNGYANDGAGIHCETTSSNIFNCAIIGNFAENNGGGIWIGDNAETAISNCDIVENWAIEDGGGLYCENSDPKITHSLFLNNIADDTGGGFYSHKSNPFIKNTFFIGNSAQEGGGLELSQGNPLLIHCTIANNIAEYDGQGIFSDASTTTITNCIIADGFDAVIPKALPGEPIITYSNIIDGWPGLGNINEDPLFVGNGDYHLTLESPCIDSGTDAGETTDFDDHERPLGNGFDMGAYEFIPPEECEDLDGDGYENLTCGGDDCNDHDPNTYPNADEVCDANDNDCDEEIPDDEVDEDLDGYMICQNDCDDTDPNINVDAEDPAGDGIDQNCDGQDGDLPDGNDGPIIIKETETKWCGCATFSPQNSAENLKNSQNSGKKSQNPEEESGNPSQNPENSSKSPAAPLNMLLTSALPLAWLVWFRHRFRKNQS